MKNPRFPGLFALVLLVLALAGSCSRTVPSVLVFSKTEGYRHESIEAGQAALRKMAEEKGFRVTFTEDAAMFQTDSLRNYHAVLFLNTTGDVLDASEQKAFERFIQAGGGYLGIHSATDTEYDWPWYGGLAGAYFLDHPSDPSNVQRGRFEVSEPGHWATQGMPESFEREDEFYNFRDISRNIQVVLTIDETTYQGGKNGDGHPMSWYQEYDGGRSFYTAMGHTPESFSEPLFLDHLWAGLAYVMGGKRPNPLDYSKASPEDNRFTKVVLAENLDEPNELTILDEDRVLFIQRKGEVRLFRLTTGELKTIARLPVSLKYVNSEGKESTAEDGLLAMNKDPNFPANPWIYMYYSDPEAPVNVLSRFTMEGDSLLLSSEKRMLEVGVQREECCHAGASIAWDADGNLYLSTGDNTNPHASNGYSPSDERPGRGPWDAQKSSANTNDLRGKILRIRPQPDGTYTIPEGNLFPPGTPGTRPEIYTMGHRNPYRISVDSQTGYLYWGDVGPDANQPDSLRGPAGHDEIGQARRAGNFGWPHFVGDNKAYVKYDFAAGRSLTAWDPAAPVNTSPNNTGLRELPPAEPAFIWYPYAATGEFPLMGSGGRSAMAGPVYRKENFKRAPRAFPDYYDGKLFVYEWMRGRVLVVDMNEDQRYVSMYPFMPEEKFSNPTELEFAPNGDLYMLEYGEGWFVQNPDARLVRIEYNGGNRDPLLAMSLSHRGGTVPLNLKMNALGTQDPDNDKVTYSWEVRSATGYHQRLQGIETSLNLTEPGDYEVVLTADDGQGGKVSRSSRVLVGNEPPRVEFRYSGATRSFYVPGGTLQYRVSVRDAEDGILGDGIDPNRVAVTIDYLEQGFDLVEVAQGHRSADELARLHPGRKLIDGSDCMACHKLEGASIGPSYAQVATRYHGEPNAAAYLAGKIVAGGAGVWGETPMAAHPQLTPEQAGLMAEYILGLSDTEVKTAGLPVEGTYSTRAPEGKSEQGVFVLRASYEDKGTRDLPSLQSEQTLVLRSTRLNLHNLEAYDRILKYTMDDGTPILYASVPNSHVLIGELSLEGVSGLRIMATAPMEFGANGGFVELRADSPDGTLVGRTQLLEPAPTGNPPGLLAIDIPENRRTAELHPYYLVFRGVAEGAVMAVVMADFQLELVGEAPSR